MSRILPHRLFVLSLTENDNLRRRYKLYTREYAYEQLKDLTGEDFGYDAEEWEAWFEGKSFKEIYFREDDELRD